MPDTAEAHLPLKPLVYSILLVLREHEDYGYGIAKRVARPSAGGIRLAPSNLYYVLDRLQGKGLIEARERAEPGEDPRTWYRPTALGHEVFAAETARLRTLLGAAEATSGGHDGR